MIFLINLIIYPMPRKTVSEKQQIALKKARILAVHASFGNWRDLARELDVPESTAYRWISVGEISVPRGGSRFNKITEEHKEYMSCLIESNPRITLQEIAHSIAAKYNISISKTSIWRHLDLLTYTLKDIRFEPERANIIENKVKRKEFVEKLLFFQAGDLPICFMDETNYNVHVSRSEGRSQKGTRCTTVAAGSKGSNIHTIGCMSSCGLIYYETKRGSFRGDQACEWMRLCLRACFMKFGGPIIMVIDNAPCHSKLEVLFIEPEFKNNILLRMSPYSPMFNPMENVWSVAKSWVKRSIATRIVEILQASSNLSVREYRLCALEELIEEGMRTITPMMCANFVARIHGKVADAINLVDMEF